MESTAKANRPIEFDERIPQLFVPDVLLASQHADRARSRSEPLTGERRLMAAILEDAVHVYRTQAAATAAASARLFDEAAAWIEADEPSWVFSFVSICDHLGLDPDYLRRGLRAYRLRARSAAAPTSPAARAAATENAAAGWSESAVA